MSEMDKYKDESESQNSTFHFTIKWSVVLFTLFIMIGFMFRIINPTELNLDSSEYILKAFTQERIEVWNHTSKSNNPAGVFEPGSILYIIEYDEEWALVRPLRVSFLDSVWVQTSNLSIYEEELYRQWARQYERDIVRDL
jgi:hypothetical protein